MIEAESVTDDEPMEANVTEESQDSDNEEFKPSSSSESDSEGDEGGEDEDKPQSTTTSTAGDGPHVCDKCDKVFATLQYLRKHMKRHRERICSDCSTSFAEFPEYRRHRAQAHSRKYVCDQCDEGFLRKIHLLEHVLVVHRLEGETSSSKTAEGEWICDKCGKKCTTQMHMKRHLKRHRTIFKCPKCDSEFPSSVELQKHRAKEHAVWLNCTDPDCDKKFKLPHELAKHHKNFHMKAELCANLGCPVMIARNQHVKHYRVCLYSPRNMSRQSVVSSVDSLPSSSSSVMNETLLGGLAKPFKCNTCSKSFARSRYLTKHVTAVHLGEKTKQVRHAKYTCDWENCGKEFTIRTKYEGHMNAHRGLKPCACPACPMTYASRERLCEHAKRRHDRTLKQLLAANGKLDLDLPRVDDVVGDVPDSGVDVDLSTTT